MEKLLTYLKSLDKAQRKAFFLACKTTEGYVRKVASRGDVLGPAICVAIEQNSVMAVRGDVYVGSDGIMVLTANGNMIYSHHWVVGRRAAEDVNRYLTSFGMSPSARGRVSPSENRQQSLDLSGEGGNAFGAL
ncbi:MAG: P27 family phage terminase small subunit [Gallionella sp.]|nr:P27 family phage terminase small subunit [Gallionella sp.]